MWDLSAAGLEPVSPALAGGFLTTAPPGKEATLFLCLDAVIVPEHLRWKQRFSYYVYLPFIYSLSFT